MTSGERVGGQKIKELGERRCCGTRKFSGSVANEGLRGKWRVASDEWLVGRGDAADPAGLQDERCERQEGRKVIRGGWGSDPEESEVSCDFHGAS